MTSTQESFKRAYKYPIYPTPAQQELLAKSFGCSRFVYNQALSASIVRYQSYKDSNHKLPKPKVTGYDFTDSLPVLKAQYPWLAEVSSVILQQSLLHLGSAYSDFFRRGCKGYPSFKKRSAKQAISLTRGNFRLVDDKIYIAKSAEPLAVGYGRNDHIRELPSYPSSATITKTTTSKYWISFICEYTPTPTSGTEVTGLDMGIKDFLVSSKGVRVANPRYLKQYEKQLRRAQQALSKKTKSSKNYFKAKLKVAKLHELIRNLRSNFQHQLSRQLINDNQVIGIETLKVANMVKNRKLSKHIADVSWSSFFNKLIYKSQWSQHCTIVRMDTYYPSSHICSKTKEKLDRRLKLSERRWNCQHCGATHDRDINAAINIKDKALEVIKNMTKLEGKQPYGALILA